MEDLANRKMNINILFDPRLDQEDAHMKIPIHSLALVVFIAGAMFPSTALQARPSSFGIEGVWIIKIVDPPSGQKSLGGLNFNTSMGSTDGKDLKKVGDSITLKGGRPYTISYLDPEAPKSPDEACHNLYFAAIDSQGKKIIFHSWRETAPGSLVFVHAWSSFTTPLGSLGDFETKFRLNRPNKPGEALDGTGPGDLYIRTEKVPDYIKQ
jgi:hypothetical protein